MRQFDWTGVPPDRQPEIRRRIEILERFLAIPKPTPDQRRQARAELGVSRPMFYVLLGAWTRHRKPSDIPGAKTWKSGPRGGGGARDDNCDAIADFPEPVPLESVDWSAIPAERRDEVKRRGEIVDRYLAIPKPSPDDRARAMALLGVSKSTFQKLVTAWRRTRDPTKLAGARRKPGPGGGRRILPEVECFIAETFAALGAAAGERKILDEVARLCVANGLPVPSKEIVQQRRRHALVTNPDMNPSEA